MPLKNFRKQGTTTNDKVVPVGGAGKANQQWGGELLDYDFSTFKMYSKIAEIKQRGMK